MNQFHYSPSDPFPLGRCSDGRNIHVPLTDCRDGSKWFGKLCCPLDSDPYPCQREIAFSLLAVLAGAPALQVHFVKAMDNSDELLHTLREFEPEPNRDQSIRWRAPDGTEITWRQYLRQLQSIPLLVASPWIKHERLRDWTTDGRDLFGIANIRELLRGCLVHLWIGAADENIDLNILIDEAKRAVLVDYGYAGPKIDQPAWNVNHTHGDVRKDELKRFIPEALYIAFRRENGIVEEAVSSVQQITKEKVLEILSETWNVIPNLENKRVVGVLSDELEKRRQGFARLVNHLLH